MMLLPDLTPWISQDHSFLDGWTIQGNDLRLTSAIANIGTGPLELRGGATHGTTQDVYQRIYNSDGTFTDVFAGSFVYHPEHQHIHFEDFAEFRLREVLPDGSVGAVIATSAKVSFCLLDVQQYDNSGPSSPYYLSCQQLQGISVGWADVYDKGLPGQSIDITNVPDGTYWLEEVVDPSNRIMESNETNNVARIQIDLVRPAGVTPIAPDTFEPNDSFATASILAPPEDHTYTNLSIHASMNDDYYRVTAAATGTMRFDLAFKNAQGNIDMEVYDASQTLLGSSTSTSDSEEVTIFGQAGHYYYVHVFGYQGATNPDYSLTVHQPLIDIRGTQGSDVLVGHASQERILGFGGNDRIFGGGGNDLIIGGHGVDILNGGLGDDTFAFRSVYDSRGDSGFINGVLDPRSGAGKRDIITDFTQGQDKIDLSFIDADSHHAGNQAFTFAGKGNMSSIPGRLIYREYDAPGTAHDKTIIYGDVNGDGKADFQIELKGLFALHPSDFIL